MIELKSPRAGRPHGHEEKNRTPASIADRFPRCELHGVRVVYTFPDGCALGVVNPLDRVFAIQRRGWRQVGDRTTEDHSGGLTLLEIGDVCNKCVDRLLPNRHVRSLRERTHRHD